jgi:AcrR family transcriptional regulator
MTMKSQKQRDRDVRSNRMRRRILQTALKQFVRLNYSDVTIRKLAAAIGYSPGNIYYYFTNKSAIFAELRREGFQKLHDAQVAARQSSDPRNRLPAHAQAYVNFALTQPEYYELMFLLNAPMPKPSKKDTASAAAASFDLLIEDVEDAIGSGILPPARSTRRIALLFLSLLHGLVALMLRQRVSMPSSPSPPDMASQTIDMLFEYIGFTATPSRARGQRSRRSSRK